MEKRSKDVSTESKKKNYWKFAFLILLGIVLGSSIFCLLYTSDAADEEDSVDLGGCRIINKQKKKTVAELKN